MAKKFKAGQWVRLRDGIASAMASSFEHHKITFGAAYLITEVTGSNGLRFWDIQNATLSGPSDGFIAEHFQITQPDCVLLPDPDFTPDEIESVRSIMEGT